LKIVIIDDEALAIEEICYFLKDYPVEIIGKYGNPMKALEEISIDNPDVIFVDIDMPNMNGIELSKRIKVILPNCINIFVTAYSSYALEAYTAHPIDYMLKPINAAYFAQTMCYLVKQFETTNQHKKHAKNKNEITIKCFGKFEILNKNGQVVKFPTKKARELIAYLLCQVDKPIYRDEILEELFPLIDYEKALNNFYVTLHRIKHALKDAGVDRNSLLFDEYSITVGDGICEYVDFCRFIRSNKILDDSCIETAEQIIENYNGELFTDIDTSWIDENRKWHEIHMESMMLDYAQFYIGKRQYEKAENTYKKLVQINSMSIVGYENLLDLYIKLEDRVKYRSCYKKYEALMKEEYDTAIDKVYINYYLRIDIR